MTTFENVATNETRESVVAGRTAPVAPANRTHSPLIRALLRDTGLRVTTLAQGGSPTSFGALRAECLNLMKTFSSELERERLPEDVQRDAEWAQCALLDEAALRHLKGDDRDNWDARPLQVERFGRHDGGTYVFERLQARMRESAPDVDLLQAYAAILGLGFLGRYARDGEHGREAIVSSLDAQLERLGIREKRNMVSDHSASRVTDWLYRLSPWGVFGIACIVAAIVWFTWDRLLATQLAHLLQSRP